VTTHLLCPPPSSKLINPQLNPQKKVNTSPQHLYRTPSLRALFKTSQTRSTPLTQSKCTRIASQNSRLQQRQANRPVTHTRQTKMLGLQCLTSVVLNIAISFRLQMVTVSGAAKSAVNSRLAYSNTLKPIYGSFSRNITMNSNKSKKTCHLTQTSVASRSIMRS